MTESLHNIETTQHNTSSTSWLLSCHSPDFLLVSLVISFCSYLLTAESLLIIPWRFKLWFTDTSPMHFSWQNSWEFSHPHMQSSQYPNSALPQLLIPIPIPDLCCNSFQFISQTSVVTSYCNSSLSYDRLTLQLRSLIIPVHFLQYSNSENDHTPLQSESIPSPSCPWSSTLL